MQPISRIPQPKWTAVVACASVCLASAAAWADLGPKDLPGTAGAPAAAEPQVVVEVTSAVARLPVLLVVPSTAADNQLADQIRHQIRLTGLFAVPTPQSVRVSVGIPDKKKWPALTTAAVVVSRKRPPGRGFPVVSSATQHKDEPDLIRKRELTEYPGASASTASVMADAIMADALGLRTYMSGRVVMTDASTRGERSVRVIFPDGSKSRRVSGFGSLSRGADIGKDGRVWYATEDASGKLKLFRQGETTPTEIRGIKGYIQSVGYAPGLKHAVVSVGEGDKVRTWKGPSLDQVTKLNLPANKIALSPSIDDKGRVVHVVGPIKGPFSVYVDNKRVTPRGMWAAIPSFCSTAIEDRVVYMVRAGRSWNIRITSLTNGSSRTIASRGLSPTCSPDGRTVAFYSPGKYGKGPGVYLASHLGGMARKVWSGQAASLRWRGGEKLPTRTEERVAPPAPPPPPEGTEEPAAE